ncbi:MAG TPA: YraN family protein [Candidatus Desulfofervidus auxilii]|uniref:UPF0102 protein ENJ03_02655 n=1 Tax=Desulfofervidus auxilii TaxID=1621989 RepID=A0A7V1N328_DESA2|nr:YraN family protein [Candidatus Desulfofervidus auxilii]
MKFWKFSEKKHDIGEKGEVLAKRFLQKQGYKIITTNYGNKLGEIDIIALEKDTIVFIEVKTRSNNYFGRAKEAIDKHKKQKIAKVALYYLRRHCKEDVKARFDVIAIDNDKIELIRNAYSL